MLDRLMRDRAPLSVLDTHAGAGVYDLTGEAARRSGEADAGVVRLMDDSTAPAVFDRLKQAVRAENGPEAVRFYPGSPALILGALRPADRYLGCELRPDDRAELAGLIRMRAPQAATVFEADGYEVLIEGRAGRGRRLVLIDPPFERGDDYLRLVEAIGADCGRGGEAAYMVWVPLKDLQTFDSFLGGMETLGLPGLAVETRLRPLDRPLRLNGCAVVLLGARELLDAVAPAAEQAAGWTAARLGDVGAAARIEGLN